MKAGSGRFFFIFIVVMFVLAAAVFSMGIFVQYTSGQKNAQNNFQGIVQNIAAVFANGAEDKSSIKLGMESVFKSYPNLAAVIVQIAGKPVFAQQRNAGFISFSPSGDPVITASSSTLTMYTAPFSTGDGTSAFISAVLYVMQPMSVYKTACVSFFIILAATVFAIVVILASPSGKKTAQAAVEQNAPQTQAESAAPPADEPAEVFDMPEGEDFTEEEEEEEADADYSAEDAEADGAEADDESDETPPESDADDDVSPITGFSPESLLINRLNDELEQAREQNEDLGVFVILFSALDCASKAARKVFKLISGRFQTAYTFDYETNGAAVIIPNSSIDDSLKKAEQLYTDICEALGQEGEQQLGIGVSNRTNRIISAGRLIGEAKEAAQRAVKNPETPIVVLKIDPQKYRKFLSGGK